MIQLIDGLPDNVVAAICSGHITADDYEATLIPAVDAALESNDKIRLLYVLGSDFDGYEPKAGLDDAKLGVHHWTALERVGLVTDSGAYRALLKAFGFVMPGQVRVFADDELDDAKAWIAAD